MKTLKWRQRWHSAALENDGENYRLIEDFASPYSGKLRSYLRYKNIPYKKVQVTKQLYTEKITGWLGFPMIPVLLTPDDKVMQDTTPIIEWFESKSPDMLPEDPALLFLMWLIEDFADEYLVRIIMHYRWGNDISRTTLSSRLGRSFGYLENRESVAEMQASFLKRQSQFDRFLGLQTGEARADLDAQTLEMLSAMEDHLADHPFLFGDKPSVADLAMYGMLWAHLFNDPFSASIIEEHAPITCSYLEVITDFGDTRGAVGAKEFGNFAGFDAVVPGLEPLLKLISETYLPWMLANAQAIANGDKKVPVTIRGVELTFPAAHYKATSFERVQRFFTELSPEDKGRLQPVLERCGLWQGIAETPVLHCDIFDGLNPPFVENGYADLRTKQKLEVRNRTRR